MFAKLLKYDFRSTWGLLGLLCLISLGAGTLGSIFVRIMNANNVSEWGMVLLVIAFATIVFYLIVHSVISMFLLLGRFYKSRFTDEGYLTFTLPVTTHQVLLSGAINCGLGTLLSMLVTALSFGIMLFFGIEELDGERLAFFGRCFQLLPEFVGRAGVGNTILFLAMILSGMVMELMTILLAITVSAVLAKKYFLLWTILAYYGIHTAVTVLSVLIMGAASNRAFIAQELQVGFVPVTSVMVLFMVALSVGQYFLMYALVHKKLNLN